MTSSTRAQTNDAGEVRSAEGEVCMPPLSPGSSSPGISIRHERRADKYATSWFEARQQAAKSRAEFRDRQRRVAKQETALAQATLERDRGPRLQRAAVVFQGRDQRFELRSDGRNASGDVGSRMPPLPSAACGRAAAVAREMPRGPRSCERRRSHTPPAHRRDPRPGTSGAGTHAARGTSPPSPRSGAATRAAGASGSR